MAFIQERIEGKTLVIRKSMDSGQKRTESGKKELENGVMPGSMKQGTLI